MEGTPYADRFDISIMQQVIASHPLSVSLLFITFNFSHGTLTKIALPGGAELCIYTCTQWYWWTGCWVNELLTWSIRADQLTQCASVSHTGYFSELHSEGFIDEPFRIAALSPITLRLGKYFHVFLHAVWLLIRISVIVLLFLSKFHYSVTYTERITNNQN